VTLTLRGHVPSKKNNWRPRAGGGIRTDKDTKEFIQALTDEAWIEWRKLHAPEEPPMLEHPSMMVCFYVRDRRSDRDNKLSTLLDVLQKAGVIRNDNVKWFNAELRLMPAIVASEEKVVVEFL
jgi:Holliday junction resolvase RusA-like endonuclease